MRRKEAIKNILYLLSFPFVVLGSQSVLQNNKLKKKNKLIIKFDVTGGDPTIIEDVALIKNGGKTEVFSARCTHLGCIVKKSNGKFVCPCHGSEFDYRGEVEKGPATQPLTELSYTIDRNNNIVVNRT